MFESFACDPLDLLIGNYTSDNIPGALSALDALEWKLCQEDVTHLVTLTDFTIDDINIDDYNIVPNRVSPSPEPGRSPPPCPASSSAPTKRKLATRAPSASSSKRTKRTRVADSADDDDEDAAATWNPNISTRGSMHSVTLSSGALVTLSDDTMLVDREPWRLFLKAYPDAADQILLKALRRHLQNRRASRGARENLRTTIDDLRLTVSTMEGQLEAQRVGIAETSDHVLRCAQECFAALPGGDAAIALFLKKLSPSFGGAC